MTGLSQPQNGPARPQRGAARPQNGAARPQRFHARAPGKINLCLALGPTRADGRHELVTVFESVSLADELVADVLPPGRADEVICPGVEGPNLAARALERLRETGWGGPPLRITIAKHVPVAAGMGGGSADGAAALRLAAALEPVPPAVLDAVARELGADVPAQVRPGRWLGTGVGEVLEAIPPPPEHALLIVPLGRLLATPSVFAEGDRLGLGRPEGELARLAAALRASGLGQSGLFNDLEPAAISLCPEVGEALRALRAAGAAHALVCGSGPTVAGVWWGDRVPEEAVAALRVRWPRAQVALPVEEEFGAPQGA